MKDLISIFLFHVAPWFAERNGVHPCPPHYHHHHHHLHPPRSLETSLEIKVRDRKAAHQQGFTELTSGAHVLLTDAIKDFVRAAFVLGAATLSDLTLRPSDLCFFPCVCQ